MCTNVCGLIEHNSRKSTVYPKKARNVDGAFVFIVNDEDYKQVMTRRIKEIKMVLIIIIIIIIMTIMQILMMMGSQWTKSVLDDPDDPEDHINSDDYDDSDHQNLMIIMMGRQ